MMKNWTFFVNLDPKKYLNTIFLSTQAYNGKMSSMRRIAKQQFCDSKSHTKNPPTKSIGPKSLGKAYSC